MCVRLRGSQDQKGRSLSGCLQNQSGRIQSGCLCSGNPEIDEQSKVQGLAAHCIITAASLCQKARVFLGSLKELEISFEGERRIEVPL